MTEKKKRPRALSTPRRLTEEDILKLRYGTGPAGRGVLSTTESRLRAFARSEAERRAMLRVIALDYFNINTTEEGWEARYIERLEEEAFAGFRLAAGPGRPKAPKDDASTRLLIVATLLTRRDPATGEQMNLHPAAESLARSLLNSEDLRRRGALDKETQRLIDIYKDWRKSRRRQRG